MRKGQKTIRWSSSDVPALQAKANDIEAAAKELDRTVWTVYKLLKRHGVVVPEDQAAIARSYYESTKGRKKEPKAKMAKQSTRPVRIEKKQVIKIRDFTGYKYKQINPKTWVLVNN